MRDYELFYDDFMSEVRNFALGESHDEDEAGEKPRFREDAFTKVFLDYTEDRGLAPDAELCYFEASTSRGNLKVNAWTWDEDEARLSLCTTLFSEAYKDKKVPAADIEGALKKAMRTLDFAMRGHHQNMEPASPAFDMMKFMHEIHREVVSVNVILFSNGRLPAELKSPATRESTFTYKFQPWDLTRLFRLHAQNQEYESITIDFKNEFNRALPCLDTEIVAEGHKVYLALMPGEFLSELYDEYGQRLLDLNVRSFLQVRNKVNRGIRETLAKQPENFLAYNNGITVTVEDLSIDRVAGGGTVISSVKGFQVVNGGQTMASIHRAAKIDKADISRVFVQAKITLVAPEAVNDLAPMISKYANSQNAVRDADFSSNEPIHVELQRHSERIWVPGEQSRWYYERTRGQYQVEKNSSGRTKAQLKKWESENPTSQKFTKTDMAKYENSWEQYPQLVSLGAQKNFVNFMYDLKRDKGADWVPDEIHYKELVAKAIIFKAAEKAARATKLPSYRANVVTYMVAYLSKKAIGRLKLEKIWNDQAVPPSVYEAFLKWAPLMHEALAESAGERNVTEWCKKDACWEKIENWYFGVPDDLKTELQQSLPEQTAKRSRFRKGVGLSAEDNENIARTMELDGKAWFEISLWGRTTKLIDSKWCNIALTLSRMASEKWESVPSPKQAYCAVQMLNIARENSFDYSGRGNNQDD